MTRRIGAGTGAISRMSAHVPPRPEPHPEPPPSPLPIPQPHPLPEPREVLEEVGGVMPRERVLVITALGTMTADEVVRLGFRVAKRPISVGDIVRAATEVLRRATST